MNQYNLLFDLPPFNVYLDSKSDIIAFAAVLAELIALQTVDLLSITSPPAYTFSILVLQFSSTFIKPYSFNSIFCFCNNSLFGFNPIAKTTESALYSNSEFTISIALWSIISVFIH